MPEYLTPGVYIEEVSAGARPVESVGTRTAAFIGIANTAQARSGEAVGLVNWGEYRRIFADGATKATPLTNAVFGFFLNGGARAYVVNIANAGELPAALRILSGIDDIALVAAPGLSDPATSDALLSHCEASGTCFAIIDGPAEVSDINALIKVGTVVADGPAADGDKKPRSGGSGAYKPRESERGYGAFYHPHVLVRDALDPTKIVATPPSGHIAGMFARNDAERGVFKAPANMSVRGALGL
ncbi:MAG: phage tail sheath subtilisin-like domain-containing protein, partial [Deltaproteobacteria bacterium]